MKKELFEITENREAAAGIYKLVLRGETREAEALMPGQFVNVAIEGKYLRRPISVCDYEDGSLTLMYKVVGEGTEIMSGMREGASLELLLPLGNGFDLQAAGEKPMLIGGGMGAAPLLYLAKELRKLGREAELFIGVGEKAQDYVTEEFKKEGFAPKIASIDGSLGAKGLVTDILPDGEELKKYTHYYTCGPEAMMKAVRGEIEEKSGGQLCGELSFEARMGCGFGACMGCTCRTKYGNKRICKDGPVLKSEEVIW